MLVGIVGQIGSGKTIYAVRCIKKDFNKGKKIIANLELFNIPFEKFNIELMFDNEYRKQLSDATLLLDEITVYMDCRLPSKKQGLLMGYLVLQSRKRNIDIYYTTQDLSLVDYNRLVRYTDIIVYASPIFINKNGKIEELEGYKHYMIADMRRYKNNVIQFNMNIKPYYDCYDTNEIIEPSDLLKK